MNASTWFDFFEWFEQLPSAGEVLDSSDRDERASMLPVSLGPVFEVALHRSLLTRFDWLSDSVEAYLARMLNFQLRQRDEDRAKILLASTRKRVQEANPKSLFSSKREKWESAQLKTTLDRQIQTLEWTLKERANERRNIDHLRFELLESIAQLPNTQSVKFSNDGIFRLSQLGDQIQKKVVEVGRQSCQGWSIDDIFLIGHLIQKPRVKL